MIELNKLQYEGYVDGAIYTRNLGILYKIPEKDFILVCIPKLGTPICAEEIAELNSLQPDALYICSVDSPETAEGYFEQELIDLPFLRLNPVDSALSDFINEDGYTPRVTIYVVDGKVKATYKVRDDEKRNIEKMLNIAYDFTK